MLLFHKLYVVKGVSAAKEASGHHLAALEALKCPPISKKIMNSVRYQFPDNVLILNKRKNSLIKTISST